MEPGGVIFSVIGLALIWLGIRIGRIVLDWAEPFSPDTGNDDPRPAQLLNSWLVGGEMAARANSGGARANGAGDRQANSEAIARSHGGGL